MSAWIAGMNCYILAGGDVQRQLGIPPDSELTRLERSYRSYAAIFEKVKLVIKKEHAKEQLLNYPYVCDEHPRKDPIVGVAAALNDANTEAVFIGTTGIADFPLKLLYNLLKQYNGEAFMGYATPGRDGQKPQPLFGIYHKKLAERLAAAPDGLSSLETLGAGDMKFLPFPDGVDASCLGLK